jgi:CheY-like chemotaxis protein
MPRSRGFDAVAASNGDTALAAILCDGGDGLVSDFQMPGLNGLTLSRLLRGSRDYAVLPIVAFTGRGRGRSTPDSFACHPELRILHKPMRLRKITYALTEMTPTTAIGFGVGTARARAHVASATAVA